MNVSEFHIVRNYTFSAIPREGEDLGEYSNGRKQKTEQQIFCFGVVSFLNPFGNVIVAPKITHFHLKSVSRLESKEKSH